MTDAPNISQPAPVVVSPPAAPPSGWTGSAQDRWIANQAERSRADPLLDQTKVLVRQPDGSIAQHEKIVDENGVAKTGKRIDPQDSPPGDAHKPPEGEPKVKIGEVELTETEIRDLMAHKAFEDSRKALIPQKPGDYKLELPADLKLPGDVKYEFNPNDPIKGPALAMSQEYAHRKGYSQADFSEMGVYAASQAHEIALIDRAVAAEREALGATATPRVSAVMTWLRGQFGDKAAQPFLASMVKASQVDVWEKIMQRYAGQGAHLAKGTGREPPGPTSPSDAEWNAMSYGQWLAYAQAAGERARSGGRR